MIKSTFTIIFVLGLFVTGFAQQGLPQTNVESNLNLVSEIAKEKSDITGTISNVGGFNMFVDDAKVEVEGELVKKFSDKNMQTLVQKGYKHIQKSQSESTCYRYRIVTNDNGVQDLFLYRCSMK